MCDCKAEKRAKRRQFVWEKKGILQYAIVKQREDDLSEIKREFYYVWLGRAKGKSTMCDYKVWRRANKKKIICLREKGNSSMCDSKVTKRAKRR